MNWWEVVGRRNVGRITRDNLAKSVPTPRAPAGHVLPYVKDDWGEIQAIRDGKNPMFVSVKIKCLGCSVGQEIISPRAFVDQTIKWLCDDCLDERGFAWGSSLTPDQLVQYQLVQKFDDDTLVRRLDKSPNHKDPMHDPFDPADNRKKVI